MRRKKKPGVKKKEYIHLEVFRLGRQLLFSLVERIHTISIGLWCLVDLTLESLTVLPLVKVNA